MEVDPPSRPMKPRTTWPGLNVAGMNVGMVCFSTKASSSSWVSHSPRLPEACFSSSRPTSM